MWSHRGGSQLRSTPRSQAWSDIARKLALAEHAAAVSDVETLVVLTNEWATHPDFDPAWQRVPTTPRQLAERFDALVAPDIA